MLRGVAIAVTAVSGTYQWADTQRMALGLGKALPIASQPSVQVFRCKAFSGFPCPKKIAGMGFVIWSSRSLLPKVFVRFFPAAKLFHEVSTQGSLLIPFAGRQYRNPDRCQVSTGTLFVRLEILESHRTRRPGWFCQRPCSSS